MVGNISLRAMQGFGQSKWSRMLIMNWAFCFVLLLILIFSFTGAGFLNAKNLQNILYAAVIIIILAAAETPVIITGGIDLSVGFVMGFSAVVTALCMNTLHAMGYPQVMSITVGILTALCLCVIPGFVSGVLIAWFRVPPFIATLGMYGVANGVTLKLSGGFPVAFIPPAVIDIGNGYLAYWWPQKAFTFFTKPEGIGSHQLRELIGIVPNSFLFCTGLIAIIWFILVKTQWGRHIYAIGGNIDAASRSGIPVKLRLLAVYIQASMLAGIAGIVFVFQTGVGSPTTFAASYELFAISAVVIGGASLFGGKGSVVGALIGAVLLVLIENGLSISGVEPFYRYIAVGLILIIAVVVDELFPDLF